MATIAQLRKLAVDYGLLAMMESRGFKETSKSKLFFYRRNTAAIYQIICFDILRGGENLEIGVFNWVPELEKSYDLSHFPKGIAITNGGNITKKGEIGIGLKFWDLRNLSEITNIFDDIMENIDQVAIPWLDSIETRSDMISVMFPDYKENPVFAKVEAGVRNPT